jgi:branched-chain amino acid transport system ATP-binding protein
VALLELEDVHLYYGKIHALKGVSLKVEAEQIVTLVGANGAGKSSTLNTISGLLMPSRGHVRLSGEDLEGCAPHEIVSKGVVQVPEGRRIFGRLTVRENLNMGAYARTDDTPVRQDLERVLTLFPRLRERLTQVAGTLSGGEQQMLGIARGLMAGPRVLLLDEPSMGLAPLVLEQIFEAIQEINQQGVTILLVEQNAYMALSLAHVGYVLESGQVVLSGTGEELLNNDEVKRAYLG